MSEAAKPGCWTRVKKWLLIFGATVVLLFIAGYDRLAGLLFNLGLELPSLGIGLIGYLPWLAEKIIFVVVSWAILKVVALAIAAVVGRLRERGWILWVTLAILTGILCLLGGAVLIRIGSRLAGPAWILLGFLALRRIAASLHQASLNQRNWRWSDRLALAATWLRRAAWLLPTWMACQALRWALFHFWKLQLSVLWQQLHLAPALWLAFAIATSGVICWTVGKTLYRQRRGSPQIALELRKGGKRSLRLAIGLTALVGISHFVIVVVEARWPVWVQGSLPWQTAATFLDTRHWAEFRELTALTPTATPTPAPKATPAPAGAPAVASATPAATPTAAPKKAPAAATPTAVPPPAVPRRLGWGGK